MNTGAICNHLLWITSRSITTITAVWGFWWMSSPVTTSRRGFHRSWITWLFGTNRSFFISWWSFLLFSGRATRCFSRAWRATWTLWILKRSWSPMWFPWRKRPFFGTIRSSFNWSFVRTTGSSLRTTWSSYKGPSLRRTRSPWWSTKNRGPLHRWSFA